MRRAASSATPPCAAKAARARRAERHGERRRGLAGGGAVGHLRREPRDERPGVGLRVRGHERRGHGRGDARAVGVAGASRLARGGHEVREAARREELRLGRRGAVGHEHVLGLGDAVAARGAVVDAAGHGGERRGVGARGGGVAQHGLERRGLGALDRGRVLVGDGAFAEEALPVDGAELEGVVPRRHGRHFITVETCGRFLCFCGY